MGRCEIIIVFKIIRNKDLYMKITPVKVKKEPDYPTIKEYIVYKSD
jgi:hypothetical protein